MSPLKVPELLDQCLRHLLEDPATLLACALVRRSWTFPAQTTLYWHILLAVYPGDPDLDKGDRRCSLLLNTIRTSPRLASLIRSLELSPEDISPENLTALLNVPLPMLHTLYLAYIRPSQLVVVGMKQLLSRATLKHVQIRCRAVCSEDIFQSLFESHAPSVKEMEFFPLMFPLTQDCPTVAYRGMPRQIESFRFTGSFSAGTSWLESAAASHYLDFSHLRRLNMGVYYHYLTSPRFLAAARTLEALKLEIDRTTGIIDISAYTRVETLFISCEEDNDIWTAAGIVQSIPQSTRIQKLWISGPLSDSEMAVIREHLAETVPASLFDVLEVRYVEPLITWNRSPIIPEFFRRNPSGRYTLGHYF